MTKRARSLLQIPQGTEGFYLEEAYRHRKLTAQIEHTMYNWGYLPVQTPVFDFFDVYEPFFTGSDERRIYRLIDREGDLLLLRSDITLFLARQMGMVLTDEDLPTRVCYFDTILRHQDAEDISKNEFFQAGAELIGLPGVDGDLEIILLMQEVLSQLPLPAHRCHIGSRAIADAALSSLPAAEQTRARRLIAMRDRAGLKRSLRAGSFEVRRADYLCDLFGLIGERNDLERVRAAGAKQSFIDEPTERELERLSLIFWQLGELGLAEGTRVDLSEIGAQPYYTGTVFQVYMDGQDSSVASGGRYDKLLDAFGFSAPSVGFSTMLRRIENALTEPSIYNPSREPETVSGQTFVDRYRSATAIRASGRSAIL